MKNSVVCADASLSLKLVIPEALSDRAQALWMSWHSKQIKVIAPSLWAYEVTSVVRNKAYRGLIDKELESEVLTAVHHLPVQLFRPENLHRRAWELARQFNRPSVYDMHYLALAEIVDCPYWTADERLYNAVHLELDWSIGWEALKDLNDRYTGC
jgi:predicted nucleic acid-binding protein